MTSREQTWLNQNESDASLEKDKKKYLQFGKYTQDCPPWLLEKVAAIDKAKIDQAYIEKVLWAIVDEFNPQKHQTTSTKDIKKSRLITVREILEKRQTSCGSQASVVAAVLRNLKIPTKLIHGMYIDDTTRMYHAWNEVLINNKWVPFDITNPRDNFKINKSHIKKLEALDWSEFEKKADTF